MPSSINGCGTKYYGQRDFREDGSHLTTNFFCLLFVPLIPLQTIRVIPAATNSWVPFSRNLYTVLEKSFPNPLQVGSVYLAGAYEVGCAILLFGYIDPYLKVSYPYLANFWGEVPIFLVTSLPLLFFVRWLRGMARNRILRKTVPC